MYQTLGDVGLTNSFAPVESGLSLIGSIAIEVGIPWHTFLVEMPESSKQSSSVFVK